MSSDTDSPFDDDKDTSLLEGIAKELSGVDVDDIAGMIRRIAEVDDELSSRGVDPLVKEKEELRKTLKKYMLKHKIDTSFDETSGWEAVMIPRSYDVWDMDAFSSLLSPTQKKRYIRRMIDETAAKEGIANGDLSRAQLEAKGAVRKEAGQKALYVRERKGGTKQ